MPETSKVSMDLLLYLYGLYKTNLTLFKKIDLFFDPPAKLMNTTYSGGEESDQLKEDFLKVCQTADEMRRSLDFLENEGFISYNNCKYDEWSVEYKEFNLHSSGIKIIEGINDKNHRKSFSDKFHITINVNLESLIKNELGGLNLSLLNLKDLLGML